MSKFTHLVGNFSYVHPFEMDVGAILTVACNQLKNNVLRRR